MNNEEKVTAAVTWFMNATRDQQKEAVEALFDYAIRSEWVGVWGLDDRAKLAEESGRPIDEYAIPYFTTCGEPIAKASGGCDERRRP